jgi:iron complex transport system substrate-binding protein
MSPRSAVRTPRGQNRDRQNRDRQNRDRQVRSMKARSMRALACVVLAATVGACAASDVREPPSATALLATEPDIATPLLTVADAERIEPLEMRPTPVLPVTITDATGADVTITSADRIVALNGSLAEIVFTLGLGDQVVGRDATTTFVEAGDLPLISTGHDVSAEGVLSLRPTVVLADTRTGPPEVLQQLRSAGVPIVILAEAWSLEEVSPRVLAVADALGVREAGQRLAARTDTEIAAVQARSTVTSTPARVAFLYLRGGAGIYLLGGDGSGTDSLLEAIGVIDVGTDLGLGPFTPLTSEALVTAQPDVLLVMDGGLESVGGIAGMARVAGVAQTPAGMAGRFVALPDGLLLNFGPRTGRTLALLAQQVDAALASVDRSQAP